MRVIGGEYAKRTLKTLSSQLTRPTSDKVKESLFNSLGQYFDGGRALDLYGGSGALAIESVSRGMDKAIIVDKAYQAIKIIKENVAMTKEESKFEVLKMPDEAALKKLATDGYYFDYVFLDPPYAKQRIANVMAELVELNLLAEDAIIVAETDKDTEIGVGNSYCLIKEKKYGQTMIRIFRYEGVTES
ncbi:16S rRNA (guanine(966)-N(2))-methyltransferase RsmD [Holzapfeliella floricola]|uniref:RsmD family RNA methyltransferase n=1 Tax=Holzapfeliella floricola DSM 23037 = JCM 16512 TaxID=1423744 RepID=A0A0R2DHN4_9LACO|nr:16S rRNA (guanine(966)-N(2))-methyltransferase RsmD [Holzapfeliella floricola]KRN03617.1 RsmD family RNA methyltransferase [Holzapfeliella floricola DSM 23037 = JCM 16512]